MANLFRALSSFPRRQLLALFFGFGLLIVLGLAIKNQSPEASQVQQGALKVAGTIYEDGVPVAGATVYCLYTTSDSLTEWKEVKAASDNVGKFECKNIPVAPGATEIPVVAQKGDEWCDAKAKITNGTTQPVALNLDKDKAGESKIYPEPDPRPKDAIKVKLTREYPKATGGIKAVEQEVEQAEPAFNDLPAGYYSVAIVGAEASGHGCGKVIANVDGTDTDVKKPLLRLACGSCKDLSKQPSSLPNPQPTSGFVHTVEIESARLTAFHGKPTNIRAGVLLPKTYFTDQAKNPVPRYPVRIRIGGRESRYTEIKNLSQNDRFPMIMVHFDSASLYGDPLHVNSANNGPLGDATVFELIPEIERRFRGIGKGCARFLDGHSSGGWASLALQVFYPDEFGGTWSGAPDPVDFRALQLINIYQDQSAYIKNRTLIPTNRQGKTIQKEAQEEWEQEQKAVPRADGTRYAGQWTSWDAVFGPKGANGRPMPLFNRETGVIDRSVVAHWQKYDLRLYLEKNWPTIGPKLQGKIHVWVGGKDDYFLNDAVSLLGQFLNRANPPYKGQVIIQPGQDHKWRGPYVDGNHVLIKMEESFNETL